MGNELFERLVAIGAPLGPLETTQLDLVSVDALWHLRPDAAGLPADQSGPCAQGREAAAAPDARSAQISYAAAVRQGLDLCRLCTRPAPLMHYFNHLAAVSKAVDSFEEAMRMRNWAGAETAMAALRRPRTPDASLLAEDAFDELCRWVGALVERFTLAYRQVPEQVQLMVRAAFAATYVNLTEGDLDDTGADRAFAHLAHSVWREEVEALQQQHTVEHEVVRAVAFAATRLKLPRPDLSTYRELVRRWNGRCGELMLPGIGPFAAILGRRPNRVLRTEKLRTPAGWAELASFGWHTVDAGEHGFAVLVPAPAAARVRVAILAPADSAGHFRRITDVAVVDDVDPESFEAVARCALSLWDSSGRGTQLSCARDAWDSASAVIAPVA